MGGTISKTVTQVLSFSNESVLDWQVAWEDVKVHATNSQIFIDAKSYDSLQVTHQLLMTSSGVACDIPAWYYLSFLSVRHTRRVMPGSTLSMLDSTRKLAKVNMARGSFLPRFIFQIVKPDSTPWYFALRCHSVMQVELQFLVLPEEVQATFSRSAGILTLVLPIIPYVDFHTGRGTKNFCQRKPSNWNEKVNTSCPNCIGVLKTMC